jgi:4-amino-4-deoxy-L-arabinose transferase-like glycosyltransferase
MVHEEPVTDQATTPSAAASNPNARILFLFVSLLILGLALALRMVARGADPPPWLSWSAGIYSDEGIYAEDARLMVLYGQHMPGNFQASSVAPLWNVLLEHAFRRLGISLIKLRMVSITLSMVALIVFAAALRVWYDARTAVAGLYLLSISAPFVMYSRLGLLEPTGVLWLALAYFALGCAERRPRTVPCVVSLLFFGLFCGIAVVWKGTFVLPVIGLLAYAVWRHRGLASSALSGIAIMLALYLFGWYLPHQDEIARISHYYLVRQYLPHSLAGVWFNLKRGLFTGDNDGVLPYLVRFAPLLALLAIAAATQRTRSRSDIAAWLWLGVPLVVMLFMSYTPSRYFLVFWPALAILAARTLVTVAKPVFALALVALFIFDGHLLYTSYRQRTFTMHTDARTLQKVLPYDAWIGGQFAPSLCLDNSLRSVYVQEDLANTPTDIALQNLPITHVLATQTSSPAADPWQGANGELIAGPGGLQTLPIGPKFTVKVYANLEALP